jgi:multidrug efflux pump subunit AcrA (membrane-fusion protein)
MNLKCLFVPLAITALLACHQTPAGDENSTPEGYTPVTVVHPSVGSISEYIDLNATSTFLSATPVKAEMGGYIVKTTVQEGGRVTKGQELFVIQSKEAARLGNTISQLDSSFRFSGEVHIKSPGSGYITQITSNTGDYVQDGEALASLNNSNSLVFLLDLPYELTPYLHLNKKLNIQLPDGRQLQGTLSHPMPTVDPVAQTRRYIIQVSESSDLPGDLIARVKFIRKSKEGIITLPKEAILTSEVQDKFWIMKMTDSTTAVKVVIQKGIENNDRVEVISPQLQESDQILLTGNYGLPDTARVIIEKK